MSERNETTGKRHKLRVFSSDEIRLAIEGRNQCGFSDETYHRLMGMWDRVSAWFSDIVPGQRFALVGGAIRDLLIGRSPDDWDILLLGSHQTPPQLRDYPPRELAHKRFHALVAEMDASFGKVQVMNTPYQSAQAYITEQTDWTISGFAIEEGQLFMLGPGVSIMEPGAKLQLRKHYVRQENAICTMRRGFDFAKRYGLVFDGADVVWLCHRIIGTRVRFRKS